MPPRWFVACRLAAAALPISANEVDSTDGGAIPVPSPPSDFDNTTFGATNGATSVSAAMCPDLTSVPGGEGVCTFHTGVQGIGNHIDFDLTPEPGFAPVIHVLAAEGDGSTCVASATNLLSNGMAHLHVQGTLLPHHDY